MSRDTSRVVQDTDPAPGLDRRAFLGVAGAAAGVAAAAAVAPIAARAMGMPAGRSTSVPADPAAGLASPAATDSARIDDGWDVDDMWGHAPRYAQPIPHSPVSTAPVAWDRIDPIDRMLVI